MATTPAHRLSVAQTALVFRLLGDESRLRILLTLAARGERHVTALTEMLGLGQAVVSHHLMLLRRGRLVEARRDGKNVFYRVSAPVITELLRLTCGRRTRQ